MTITTDAAQDAALLRRALRAGPLGLTEAAMLFHDPTLPRTAASQEIALRALERAVRHAAARGWALCHDGVIHPV